MRFDLSQKLVLGFTMAIAIGAGITPALHLLGAPGWGAFFVAMLLGVGLGWIYAGQITANFRTLRSCTERISRGDLTAEIDIENGRRRGHRDPPCAQRVRSYHGDHELNRSTAMSQMKNARTDHPIQPMLAERWSPYVFSERSVAPQDLAALFEAARWAPTGARPGSSPRRAIQRLSAGPAWRSRRSMR